MKRLIAGIASSLALIAVSGCASLQNPTIQETPAVQVQYLEIVTTSVDQTVAMLSQQHGVTFGQPEAGYGNARIADLEGGGRLGVRAPIGTEETPVVRPYFLVEDIEAASAAAEAAGGEFAMRATEIPGQGKFAIYFLGGIQHGLWEK